MKSTKLPLIFATLTLLYILSQFFRLSNAVIAPQLVRDLDLNAETLGLLGGAFFYSFTLFQIPLGPMLDRISLRWLFSLSMAVAALGAVLFSLGQSFAAAFFGRVLIGLGMAVILMGSMKVFTLWFPPDRFSTLLGVLFSAAQVGNLMAASPLAYLDLKIGWRATFLAAGAITALLGVLAFLVLKGNPRGGPVPARAEMGILPSLRCIGGSLVFWQGALLTFARYGTFVALQGLWLGSYLMEIRGLDPIEAGHLLICIAAGGTVGAPLSGRLFDRAGSRKALILGGLGLYSLLLLFFFLLDLDRFSWGLLLFAVGFCNTFGLGIFPYTKEFFPGSISGTVFSSINFFSTAGGAFFMPLLGWVIESFPRPPRGYSPDAYHTSFLICFLFMAASLVFYAFPAAGRRPAFRPPERGGAPRSTWE
ncbi:MAG: MFS transporter [Deltaproteobacteria bacterium]|nr:MFS transporter [Deltaproteobacteria bacterium]